MSEATIIIYEAIRQFKPYILTIFLVACCWISLLIIEKMIKEDESRRN